MSKASTFRMSHTTGQRTAQPLPATASLALSLRMLNSPRYRGRACNATVAESMDRTSRIAQEQDMVLMNMECFIDNSSSGYQVTFSVYTLPKRSVTLTSPDLTPGVGVTVKMLALSAGVQ